MAEPVLETRDLNKSFDAVVAAASPLLGPTRAR
jgi:hypothetical protein